MSRVFSLIAVLLLLLFLAVGVAISQFPSHIPLSAEPLATWLSDRGSDLYQRGTALYQRYLVPGVDDAESTLALNTSPADTHTASTVDSPTTSKQRSIKPDSPIAPALIVGRSAVAQVTVDAKGKARIKVSPIDSAKPATGLPDKHTPLNTLALNQQASDTATTAEAALRDARLERAQTVLSPLGQGVEQASNSTDTKGSRPTELTIESGARLAVSRAQESRPTRVLGRQESQPESGSVVAAPVAVPAIAQASKVGSIASSELAEHQDVSRPQAQSRQLTTPLSAPPADRVARAALKQLNGASATKPAPRPTSASSIKELADSRAQPKRASGASPQPIAAAPTADQPVENSVISGQKSAQEVQAAVEAALGTTTQPSMGPSLHQLSENRLPDDGAAFLAPSKSPAINERAIASDSSALPPDRARSRIKRVDVTELLAMVTPTPKPAKPAVAIIPPDAPLPPPVSSPAGREQQEKISNYLAGRVVEFTVGRDRLTKTGRFVLNRLAVLIKANAGTGIVIQGHTDDVGDESSNLELSGARAVAARSYLIDRGIEPQRLKVQGFGERQPIADNKSARGRIRNRRIDFAVVDNQDFDLAH